MRFLRASSAGPHRNSGDVAAAAIRRALEPNSDDGVSALTTT
jgi:hypothetical protein